MRGLHQILKGVHVIVFFLPFISGFKKSSNRVVDPRPLGCWRQSICISHWTDRRFTWKRWKHPGSNSLTESFTFLTCFLRSLPTADGSSDSYQIGKFITDAMQIDLNVVTTDLNRCVNMWIPHHKCLSDGFKSIIVCLDWVDWPNHGIGKTRVPSLVIG